MTADAVVATCRACSARPFTVLLAEKYGLRTPPSIPQRCLPQSRGCAELALESLDQSSSLEEFDLRTKCYPAKKAPCDHRVEWLGSADALVFHEVTSADGALRGLKRRMQACGLCHEATLKPELSAFPLLFWHVCELDGALNEEEALVVAGRLLAHLGSMHGIEQPLPPFEAMPAFVRKATTGLYGETAELRRRAVARADRVRRENAAERERCSRTLALRRDVEAFDRDAYLNWGDARRRPCCGFHFMNVRGCRSCEEAFAKGRELNALKMNPPDWLALAVRKTELEEASQLSVFDECSVETVRCEAFLQ